MLFISDLKTWLMLVEENVERDAVHKALLSLLRQDVKGTIVRCNTILIVFLSLLFTGQSIQNRMI